MTDLTTVDVDDDDDSAVVVVVVTVQEAAAGLEVLGSDYRIIAPRPGTL